MKIKYIAEDGTEFNNQKDCEVYEESGIDKNTTKANNWLSNSYNGQQLKKKHKMNEVGTWEIRGEDPNCDFGGHHHNPYLGTVSGELFDVVKHAVSLKGFFTWGGGGIIKKVDVKSV